MNTKPEKVVCLNCLGTGIEPVWETLGMPRTQRIQICRHCNGEGTISNRRN